MSQKTAETELFDDGVVLLKNVTSDMIMDQVRSEYDAHDASLENRDIPKK